MNRTLLSFALLVSGLCAQEALILPVPPATLAPAQQEPVSEAPAATYFEQAASATLHVGNPENTAQALIAWAEAQGGWLVSWDAHSLSLRLPSAKLESFLDTLPGFGELRDKNSSLQDKTLEITDLRSRIAGRRKLLEEYFSMVKSAPYNRVQVVERELVRLIAEIERQEGQLRFLESRLATAEAVLYFQLRDRTLPGTEGNSPFPWINRLNLADFKEAF